MTITIPNEALEGAVSSATSATAAAISGWMFMGSRGAKGLPGCAAGSGCDVVTRGRWSRLGRVPVSGIGFAVYSAMLMVSLVQHLQLPRSLVSAAGAIDVPVALMVIGAAIWFVGLQLLVIRRLCPYCMAIQTCGVIAGCTVLTQGDWWHASTAPTQIAIALAGLAVLIGGQLLLKPKTFAVISSEVPAAAKAPAAQERLTEAQATSPDSQRPSADPIPKVLTNRRIRLRSGKVIANIDDFPLLGPPDAEHIIAWLFDFTCEECHHLHRLLLKAVDRYAGRLAVLAIPVPLHAGCNPTVKCRLPERVHSCAYARLDWAMWTAGRHAEWDRFVAEEAQIKPFGLALLKAKDCRHQSIYLPRAGPRTGREARFRHCHPPSCRGAQDPGSAAPGRFCPWAHPRFGYSVRAA